MTNTFYARVGKRIFDLAASAFGLILLSPLLLLVGVAVRVSSRGPVIFRQTRTGRAEKPFHIFKFRTMKIGVAGSLVTAAGDPRVTPLGHLLRKTKIDELPQLWNVLRGDMSLVGPRPEVPLYTARYTDRQRRVLDVRPGITSPQINFDEEALMAASTDREAFYLSQILPAKLEIDRVYAQNVRFFTDIGILVGTVAQLVLRPLGLSRSVRSGVSLTEGITPSRDS